MGPRFNERLGGLAKYVDYIITRFRYIEVLFHIFYDIESFIIPWILLRKGSLNGGFNCNEKNIFTNYSSSNFKARCVSLFYSKNLSYFSINTI